MCPKTTKKVRFKVQTRFIRIRRKQRGASKDFSRLKTRVIFARNACCAKPKSNPCVSTTANECSAVYYTALPLDSSTINIAPTATACCWKLDGWVYLHQRLRTYPRLRVMLIDGTAVRNLIQVPVWDMTRTYSLQQYRYELLFVWEEFVQNMKTYERVSSGPARIPDIISYTWYITIYLIYRHIH